MTPLCDYLVTTLGLLDSADIAGWRVRRRRQAVEVSVRVGAEWTEWMSWDGSRIPDPGVARAVAGRTWGSVALLPEESATVRALARLPRDRDWQLESEAPSEGHGYTCRLVVERAAPRWHHGDGLDAAISAMLDAHGYEMLLDEEMARVAHPGKFNEVSRRRGASIFLEGE